MSVFINYENVKKGKFLFLLQLSFGETLFINELLTTLRVRLPVYRKRLTL